MATQNLPQNALTRNVILTQTLQSQLTSKILPVGTQGRILDTTHFNDKIVLFDGLSTVFIFSQYDNRIMILNPQGVQNA